MSLLTWACAVRARRALGFPTPAVAVSNAERNELIEAEDRYFLAGSGCIFVVNMADEVHHAALCPCDWLSGVAT